MRIIAGLARGRNIAAVAGATRPTSEPGPDVQMGS